MNTIEDYVASLQAVVDRMPIEVQAKLFGSHFNSIYPDSFTTGIKIRYEEIRYAEKYKAFVSNCSFFPRCKQYMRRKKLIYLYKKLYVISDKVWFRCEIKEMNKLFPTIESWRQAWDELLKSYIIYKTLEEK